MGVHFGDRVKCEWVCLCHRVWSAYVHCLTAVLTFSAPEKKEKKKKMVVYFRMLDFRPKSSTNAAAYELQGEFCRLQAEQSHSECGSDSLQTADCL